MQPFLNLLDNILTKGVVRLNERTGHKTYSLFGPQMEYDLSEGLPLLTTRKLTLRPVVAELIWFLSGSTNVKYLNSLGAKVWDEWALTEEDVEHVLSETPWYKKLLNYVRGLKPPVVGDLGPIYGTMLRFWPGPNNTTVDQVGTLLRRLEADPYSRRHVVSCWNPGYLPDESITSQDNVLLGRQALAPCHTMFQMYVEPIPDRERLIMAGFCTATGTIEDALLSTAVQESMEAANIPKHRLSCKLYARSQDVPIGTAFNQAMYPILVHMICKQLNMLPGRYIHSIGDAHIYENQVELVKKQLQRTPGRKPTLTLKGDVGKSIFAYQVSDFGLEGYDPQPAIKFPIAI